MLAQEIREGLVGEFLKGLHGVGTQHLQLVPCLVMELNALSYHEGWFPILRHGDNRRGIALASAAARHLLEKKACGLTWDKASGADPATIMVLSPANDSRGRAGRPRRRG